MKKIIFLFLLVLVDLSEAQEPYRRLVNFEWEPIPGASSYEIELQPRNTQQAPYNFKTTKAEWSGRLLPGFYMMRLRSYNMNVPGLWSPASEFNVLLDKVKYIYPTANAEIKFINSSRVDFSWSPTEGADHYKIEILNAEDKVILTQTTPTPSLSINLEEGKKYSYRIVAVSPSDITSESLDTYSFTFLGNKLTTPQFLRPTTVVVKELSWREHPRSQITTGALSYYNPKLQKWEKLNEYNNLTQKKINFPTGVPEGKYKMSLQSHAPLFESSDISVLTFDYALKERVIANVNENATAAEAEPTPMVSQKKWLAMASYLITMLQYKGEFNTNSAISYNAQGGTGRLGLGYYPPNEKWGYLGIFDLSGYLLNNQNITFSSLEMHKQYRNQLAPKWELRSSFGGYFKEIPETLSTDITSSDVNVSKNSVLGAHLGAESIYQIHPKVGLETHLRLYYPFFGINITDNNKLIPTLSYQLGAMGSYKLTQNSTGYAGLTLRKDNHKYQFSSSKDSSVEITGTYLNFLLEVEF